MELGQEGSVALITYMRTDSVRVSNDALDQVRGLIGSNFGQTYLPEKPNFFKSKKDAQEAHEAVRPTDASRTPEDVRPFLSEDLFKLYQLIWQRFVASQMVPAVFDQTTIDIAAGDYTFRATGSVQKFDGYLAVYQVSAEDDEDAEADASKALLPPVAEGEMLRLETLRPEQHFTEPPPRYNEATLVKELEEKGIGRPSTYASIISTIVDREYVTKDQGRFSPTMLGEKVSVLLVKSFEDIFDVGFTARMEEELDEIEEGKLPWKKSVKEFYGRFEQDLEQAKGEMESYKAGIPTGQKCEKCGQGELLERISRHGFFLGCSRYPDCDFIRDLSPELPAEGDDGEAKIETCDNCGREMVIKRGRWGTFLACTGYPDCKTTRRLKAGTRKALQPDELLDEKCPECGSQLVKKHGQYGEFIGCTAYPKCKFIRSKTLGIKCPKCETGELVERVAKKGRRRVFYGCNKYPECDFTTPHQPIAEPCPKCGAPFIVEKRGKMGTIRACLKEGCDWEAAVPDPPPAAATPEPVGSVQGMTRVRLAFAVWYVDFRPWALRLLRIRDGPAGCVGEFRKVAQGWGHEIRSSSISELSSFRPQCLPAYPRSYENDLGQFLAFLTPPGTETPPLQDITHLLIREFVAHLHDHNLEKSSIARKLAAIRSFFKFAVREGLVLRNPARMVATPKLPKRIPSVLSAEDLNTFLDGVVARPAAASSRRKRPGAEDDECGCWSSATGQFSNCSMLPGCASAS